MYSRGAPQTAASRTGWRRSSRLQTPSVRRGDTRIPPKVLRATAATGRSDTNRDRVHDMLSDNRHRLACYMDRQSALQRDRMVSDSRATYDSCPWPSCPVPLSSFGLDRAAKHFTKHLSRDSQCESVISATEMEQHILRNHSIPSLGTLPDVRYCYECRYFCSNTPVWDQHCRQHLTDIDMFCGQVMR